MVSVIVPVYKVEEYIHQCVDSILNQSYKDFEIILVDDGSPDNCPNICEQYKKSYSNITVLHKSNGGLSDARNAGTKIAKGEYITYIDSDDFIDANYLLTLVSLIKKYDADIAVTGMRTFWKEEWIDKYKGTVKEYCFSGKEALKNMLRQNALDTSACAMLLPNKIARNYPFPYGKFHEDDFTTYKYYASANKVAVSTKFQYFYRQRKGSIMHILGQSALDELDAADNLVEMCKKEYPDLVIDAKCKQFSDYCQVFLNSDNLIDTDCNMYARIESCLNNIKKEILLYEGARKKNRLAAFFLLFGMNSLKRINFIRRMVESI